MGVDTNDSGSPFLSSINVTPFVDVVLVLLVIFMVTAPILVKDKLNIKLPKAVSGDGKAVDTLGVAINRDGQILLNGILVNEEKLITEVRQALEKNPEVQAIISSDKDASYGAFVRVVDLIKTNGLNKFAVQVEHDKAN